MHHVRSTVRKATQLVRENYDAYEVRNLATRIVHEVPGKQYTAEIAEIYKWVRDNIRYRKDPDGTEWLQTPQRTVEERAGDCDDMTILIAALSAALGHRWQFETVGATPQHQSHIAAKIHDGKRWLTVDPVLEPPQETTAPRPHDMGMFAMQARGAHIGWDQRGQQMNGTLGLPATPRQRELWWFSSYYMNPTPHGHPGGGALLPGVPETPDPRYGSPNRPGYYMGAPITLAFNPGEIQQRYQHRADGLGRIPYEHGQLGFGFLKKIGKAVGKVAKTVTKIPGVDIAAGLIPGGSTALSVAKGLTGGKKRRRRKKKKRRRTRRASSRGRRARKVSPAGAAFPPNYVTRSDMRDMRTDVQWLANLASRADIDKLIRALRGGKPALEVGRGTAPRRRRRKKKRRGRRRLSAAARRRRAKKLRRRRKPKRFQMRDKKTGMFRVFERKRRRSRRRTLRGYGDATVGVFKPSFSISLLGAMPANMDAARAAARAALKSVEFSTRRRGKPPNIKLRTVGEFQRADGLLKVDDLYGPNVRTAIAWYLGRPFASLPATHWKNPVTWVPPDKRAAARPAPPVVVAPPPAPPPPPVVVAPPPIPDTREPVPPKPPVVVVRPPTTPQPVPPPTQPAAPPPKRKPPPVLPPINVPGYTQVATSPTDPGLPGIPPKKKKGKKPTAPSMDDAEDRKRIQADAAYRKKALTPPPVVTPQPGAPSTNQPRQMTPRDVVELQEHERRKAAAAGKPVPPPISEAQAAQTLATQAAPKTMPSLEQRLAAGVPPLSSDRVQVQPGPTPAHIIPPMPGQPQPSAVIATPSAASGGDGDNELVWIALAYLWAKSRKAA